MKSHLWTIILRVLRLHGNFHKCSVISGGGGELFTIKIFNIVSTEFPSGKTRNKKSVFTYQIIFNNFIIYEIAGSSQDHLGPRALGYGLG